MIYDYSKYEMSHTEEVVFYSVGYCCVALIVFLFYHSLILSVISGALVRFIRPFYEQFKVRRRMQELEMEFKDMLYCISASVAAGRQMQEALVESVDNMSVMYDADKPIMAELLYMRRCILENNESDKVLLEDFARRSKSEDINNFVQVYTTCRNMGGDLEKIITEKGYDVSKYKMLNIEITTYRYYNSTDKNMLSTPGTNMKNYAATEILPKSKIPNGSLIVQKDGYQYRPEGWTALDVVTVGRPANVTDVLVVVDDEWWREFNFRGFNLAEKGNPVLDDDRQEALKSAFGIYVPVK